MSGQINQLVSRVKKSYLEACDHAHRSLRLAYTKGRNQVIGHISFLKKTRLGPTRLDSSSLRILAAIWLKHLN